MNGIGRTARIAIGGLLAAAASAQAQLSPYDSARMAYQQREIAIMEHYLAQAEAALARGDCGALRNLRAPQTLNNLYMNPQSDDFPWLTVGELLTRYWDVMRRYAAGCAPPPPAPPAEDILDEVEDRSHRATLGLREDPVEGDAGPEAAVRQESGTPAAGYDRSSLGGFRRALAEAEQSCDAERFRAERARLLAALDQFIAEENRRLAAIARSGAQTEFGEAVRGRITRLRQEKAEVEARRPPACERPRFAIHVGGGPLWLRLPQAGIGVIRAGPPGQAPEEYAALTDRSLLGWQIGGGLVAPVGGVMTRFSVHYAEASGESAFDLPAQPGVDRGIVYGRLSNGSSGIITPFGLSGTTRVESRDYSARLRLGLSGPPPEGEAGLTIEGGFDLARTITDYRTAVAGSGTSGGFAFAFDQERDQRVAETLLGGVLGVRLAQPLGGGLRLHAGVEGGPYRLWTDLRSRERDSANFGPAGNRDLRIDIDEEERGWGVAGRAEIGISVPLGDPRGGGTAFTAAAQAEYRSRGLYPFNPASGDDVFLRGETTRLRSNDRLAGGVHFALKHLW